MNFSDDTVVDEFLVMRCQAGDETALAAFVTKWQPPFLRYASVMTRDPELAADAVQESWIKIIRALPRLREPLKFKAWAYRIITNQCLDSLRARRPSSADVDTRTVTPIRELETAEQVAWLLSQLSPMHRSVLALHYLQGFEVAEIAMIVGKPVGTVKSRLHNAREKFRQLLEAEDKEVSGEDYGDDNGQARQQDSGLWLRTLLPVVRYRTINKSLSFGTY